jgi:PadR family transcriptional regulator PadR
VIHFFSILKEMKLPETLNDSELMTLLATLRLGEEAYGVSLCQELALMTGKTAALASVYKTLERLEKRGLVTSRMGEPSAERGGRAKRFVRVTQQGLRAIDTTRMVLNSLWQDVPAFGKGMKKERA